MVCRLLLLLDGGREGLFISWFNPLTTGPDGYITPTNWMFLLFTDIVSRMRFCLFPTRVGSLIDQLRNWRAPMLSRQVASGWRTRRNEEEKKRSTRRIFICTSGRRVWGAGCWELIGQQQERPTTVTWWWPAIGLATHERLWRWRRGRRCFALRLVLLFGLFVSFDERLDHQIDGHFVDVLYVFRETVAQRHLDGFQ